MLEKSLFETLSTENNWQAFVLEAREIQTLSIPILPEIDETDILALVKESAESEIQNSREFGNTLAGKCGSWIFYQRPTTGAEKKLQTRCGNCFSCRHERALDILRGLNKKLKYHGAYVLKICNQKETERLKRLLHKNNFLSIPLAGSFHFLIMSHRALSINHEQINSKKVIKEIDLTDSKMINALASLLGFRPVEYSFDEGKFTGKRTSGAIYKVDDTVELTFEEAMSDVMEELEADREDFELEDYILGDQSIDYYGFSIETNADINTHDLGVIAQLRAVEATRDLIPDNLDEVQEVLNQRKEIFLKTVETVSEALGMRIKVKVSYFKKTMLPSEIAWSREINLETISKLQHNMSYFSTRSKKTISIEAERPKAMAMV